MVPRYRNVFPYDVRSSILTANENDFYQELKKVVGEKYVILSKVRLSDIFSVVGAKNYWAALNRINSKHVDFLLCHSETFKPVLAIEIDDRSHRRRDRVERDEFVDNLFRSTRVLLLLRVKAKMHYDAFEIRDEIIRVLGLRKNPSN